MNSSIHAALSIARDSNYFSDADWVYKLLETAARKVNNSEEKIMMMEALVKLGEQSKIFSSNQYRSILDLFCKEDSDYKKAAKILSESDNQEIKSVVIEILKES